MHAHTHKQAHISTPPCGRTKPLDVVGISDMVVSADPESVLITYSLGSCLGVAIYDPTVRVGGMIHCMLPVSSLDPEKAQTSPAMFVDTGMMLFLKKLFEHGVRKSSAVVKIAGCAQSIRSLKSLKSPTFRIGERNVAILRKILWKNGMLIAGEDVGGNESRTMRLEIATGRFLVKRGTTVFEI